MNEKLISDVYKTAQGSLLFERGFRLDKKGNWRCQIDGSCGLSPREQRINESGGMIIGRDTDVLFFLERNKIINILKDYTKEEIAESKELLAMNKWLGAAIKV